MEGNNGSDVIWTYGYLNIVISNLLLSFDQPCEDFHFDSLRAVTFSNSLSLKLGVTLPAALVLNYSSVDGIVNYLLTLNKTKRNKSIKLSVIPTKIDYTIEKIAIIAVACRFPGNTNNLEEVWRKLLKKADLTQEVSFSRWDSDSIVAQMDLGPEDRKTLHRIRYAGLLSNETLEIFNNQMFRITDAEASQMDPTQKLAIQIAYETFLDAGLSLESLVGANIGVFVAKSENTPGRATQVAGYDANGKPSVFDGTGTALSVIAGRISYVFGLQGPCFVTGE